MFTTDEIAIAELDAFVLGIERCNPHTDGEGYEYTFAPLNLDGLLDETFAVSGLAVRDQFAFDLRIVSVRKDRAVMTFTMSALVAIDNAQFVELLDLAVERFDNV